MRNLRILVALTALALVFGLGVGCKKDGGGEGGGGGEGSGGPSLDAGQKFALEGATEDLTEVKKGLKDGKAEDMNFKCAAVSGYVEALKGVDHPDVKKLTDEARQICGFDVPFAVAKPNADKITETMAKDPDAILISECMKLGTRLDTMKEAGFGEKDEVKALAEVAKKHCE